jgi:cyclopropane fatty-acyl-phospholipid synthase-like methyltransferase
MDVHAFFEHAYSRSNYWVRPEGTSLDPNLYCDEWKYILSHSPTAGSLALDLGAGSGVDSLRLARLGYRVTSVEFTTAGSERIQSAAAKECLPIDVVCASVLDFVFIGKYDLIVCNGLLHYVQPKDQQTLVARIQEATKSQGVNFVVAFCDTSPLPECHRLLETYLIPSHDWLEASYQDWSALVKYVGPKTDTAHSDFPSHEHSYIRVFAIKP